MTDAEKREAARLFCQKWKNKGKEDEDDQKFWIEILQNILGVEKPTDYIEFQKKVIVDGNTKRIDAYIPETRVIIEQKSLGISLDKKGSQSGGIELTPYEQAKRYNDNLPLSEKARWIVTSNFAEIWIYDMEAKVPEPEKLMLENIKDQYYRLNFLIDKKEEKVSAEIELSVKAGGYIARIHELFLKQYKDPNSPETLKSLNKLCVRLVFCFYAEDAYLFPEKNYFQKYTKKYTGSDYRDAIIDVFKILNEPEDKRDPYIDEGLNAFPYVNGGLFKEENIEIPRIDDELREAIIEASEFDWSQISPTIFGAVFESTLNPETRRAGGMHYTSIENIHKVIDPLFFDDLNDEFNKIKDISKASDKTKALKTFQDKLASLKFLDPACGSGNFLTETYVSLRRLENKIILELNQGQGVFGAEGFNNPIKVSINQFYGIEINDFAVTVAKTALWIAESQMMRETQTLVRTELDFLPLKTNATIVEGNALRIDWESVVPKSELNYIMGNPPFVGHQWRSKEQVEDMAIAFYDLKNHGKLDYVSAWYQKASDFITPSIKVAFVSTNSICQGESVGILWRHLFDTKNVEIEFAHLPFKWTSEATEKAGVHCVIIGFRCDSKENSDKNPPAANAASPFTKGGLDCHADKSARNDVLNKRLYENGKVTFVSHINGYLLNAPDIFIESRGKPLTQGMPQMSKGSQPTDGGNLLLSEEERNDLIKKYPKAQSLIRQYISADDFINNKLRYCLWLKDVAPNEYSKIPPILERLEAVKQMRLKSPTKSVQKDAEIPMLFTQIRQPETDYLVVPEVSSENRRYIPIGFLTPDVIASNKLYLIPNASLYLFGIMISNVHMAWMRVTAGRLESRYSYSPAVYNNFPWCKPTDIQKSKIETSAQAILDIRAKYPNSSLADLYKDLTMPPDLRKAHQANDKAVMEAYGLNVKDTSEADCVSFLMNLYKEITSKKG